MVKNLKIWFCLLCLTGISILHTSAQQPAAKAEYLDEGDQVSTYPKVDWLKGAPITQLDKNKIYIVELWATWCVPCIMSMPHLTELNSKFKDKNVVFIAQDVMEEDKAKVLEFVQQKGDIFTFPVAFSGGKESPFSLKWVIGAGISSIPQTFVIQNNILLWITRPNMLNEKVLQLLVDGKFTKEAAEALAGKN